jgi:hypothetical protein
MVIAPILAKVTTAAKVVGIRTLTVTTKVDTGNTRIASVARSSVKSSGHFSLFARGVGFLFLTVRLSRIRVIAPLAASPKGSIFCQADEAQAGNKRIPSRMPDSLTDHFPFFCSPYQRGEAVKNFPSSIFLLLTPRPTGV